MSARFLLAAVALLACAEPSRAPTPPAEPAAHILDGARQGNPHFFFLPPLVPEPVVSGVVDPDAVPTVVICEWNTTVPGGRCENVIQQYARLDNTVDPTGADVPGEIRFTGNHYHVRWDTQECLTGPCQLDPQKVYRIRVLAGSVELGHADVDVVTNQAALKNVNTQEYIGLIDGKKLQLKFRIEQGAVAVVDAGEPAPIGPAGGEVISADGEVALTFPAGALASTTPITIEPITESRPQTGPWSDPVELGPDGTQFAQPVLLTLSYDVTKLPEGIPPEALRMSTWVNDHWEIVPGSTLNLEDATISAPITHFSGYSLSIWPNYVQGNPSSYQLYVGQTTTIQGSTWYYRTSPAYDCYTYRVWVQTSPGWGYWRYQRYCYNYTRYDWYPMSGYVYWSSLNATVASVASPGYSWAVNGSTTSPAITALTPGEAQIVGSFGGVSATTLLTVHPQLVFDVFGTGTAPVRRFGFNQGTGMNVRIPAAIGWPLTVTFTHSNPAVAGSNSSLVIPAGSTQNGITIGAGTTAGTDTLVGSAPGFGPDTLIILTGPGRVFVEGWPSMLAWGDSAPIRIRPMAPDSSIIDNAWNTTFTLGSNGGVSFSMGNAAITSIQVPNGTSSTPVFYVKGIVGGTGIMTPANAHYVTGPYAVTVGAAPVASIAVSPDPAGVRPGQTVQLSATALDAASAPVTGVSLTWTSSNTAIATVDASGRVTGIATGNVTISATHGAVSGSATVRVGVPSIAPSPGSLTIQVNQGQSKQATITINNGGGGLLTGLQASPFFNYFNGSPAPWMSATFNTTTAPATLTLTAAPGLSVSAGVHQLTFTVTADGGLSHTFHSINITVVDASIPLVNATIAPNPTSLNFQVEQGTSTSRTITINNSGTDPLTNLTAGSFSNYYNGSPAPWVTASFNTTTAPATLTITAAPGMSISAEEHHLRFDVMSPGATNSPYTFYSIKVTVTPSTVPQFTLTDLGTLGGTGWSVASTLNNSGRIVGTSNNAAFYMNASSTAPIQVPNHIGDVYYGQGVNDDGIIAWTQPYAGFLWDPATSTRQGPPPGPFTQNNRTTIVALNNTGRVLACADNGAFAQNYVWTIATNTVTLVPAAYNFCTGRINDAGVAIANADPGAGGNSRLWNEVTQTVTNIPSLGGVTIGRDLNASSVAVGSSQVGGLRHAFRFDPATGLTRDLGTLGGLESEAMGINDNGVIVGWSLNAAGQKRGFIWDPVTERMFELAPLAGYTESQANDINQSGVIVGYSGAGNSLRATRWTPQ